MSSYDLDWEVEVMEIICIRVYIVCGSRALEGYIY